MRESRFVGRRDELSTVERLLRDSRRGGGGALVVRGEAGIGKTTLLSEVLASADGMRVLHTVCVEPEIGLPFAGLHLLLRHVEPDLDVLVPAHAETVRSALGLSSGVAATDRLGVNLAVSALLGALGRERPVLVAVDDAHWLDRPSLDALTFAARRLDGLSVAIVLTARDGHAPHLPAPGLPELRLTGLADRDAETLLAAHAPDLPTAERRPLLAEARGNPLALLELRHARSNRAARDVRPPLHGTLTAVFAERVAALPARTRIALVIAAADGTCDTGTVLAAASRLGVGLDDLAPAEQAELVHFDDTCLRFRHPLVRAAAYRSAPLPDRLAAHRALAAVLTSPDDRDRRAWQLAAAATGPDEDVAAALERSAEQARARGGYAAVARAYERAADLSPRLSERGRRLSAAARAAADAGEPEQALALVREAEQYCLTPAARVGAAMIHALLAGDRHRFGEAHQVLHDAALRIVDEDPASASSLLFWAAHSAWLGGEVAKLEQAVAIAERRELVCAEHVRSLLRAASGTPSDAADALRALVDHAAAIFPPCDDRPLALRGRLAVATWLTRLHDHSGARDLASSVVRECHTETAEGVLAPALAALARAEFALGSHRRAHEAAEEGLRLADEAGQTGAAAELAGVLALSASVRGDADAATTYAARASLADASHALALLDLGHGRHDAAAHRLRATPGLVSSVPELVEATARAHRPDTRQLHDAHAAIEAYAAHTRHCGDGTSRAVTLRLRALLAEATGTDADEVTALYTRAAELHHDNDRAAFERARTELNHGEFLRRRRRTTQARAHLRTAATIFEGLGARPWAERAHTELRASGEGSQRRPKGRDLIASLTPQEKKVVDLAANGLSNRDIGERLFLSPRTVGYHLYKAYPKLGVSSRRELARLGLTG
ncbi:LuxR family transcriptional regulator [Saccharomonospora sp. NB11]|uniref:helix-turn-helix transcriptional regulator n=1 Tax=Saccharomonospora sp. NB11 TaxID=1642298 RepID=UPI0018D1D8BC|nr:LuxR family transcriptional regulator [Saccharomonospora sp. NB11]